MRTMLSRACVVAALLLVAGLCAAADQQARTVQIRQERAALQKRFEQLEEELLRELRRLYIYLGYEDQIRGMQVARGALSAEEAAARLGPRTLELFRRSYTAQDWRTLEAGWNQALGEFLGYVRQQIEASVRWPVDRTLAEYRALAAAELDRVPRAASGWPDSEAATLAKAAEVLAWTTGRETLPPAENYFATSRDRIIDALAATRVQISDELAGTGQPALSPAAGPTPAVPAEGPLNLMQNPGFEDDFAGYREEYASAVTARFTIDPTVARSGARSLKIVNDTPGGPNIYRTFVQTIGGLKPDTTYQMSFWVKSERAKTKWSFSLIMDGFPGGWRLKILTAGGAYDWTQFSGRYHTGAADYLVLRFITEDICTVWLDDIEVTQVP